MRLSGHQFNQIDVTREASAELYIAKNPPAPVRIRCRGITANLAWHGQHLQFRTWNHSAHRGHNLKRNNGLASGASRSVGTLISGKRGVRSLPDSRSAIASVASIEQVSWKRVYQA